jgi:hypothetical protein
MIFAALERLKGRDRSELALISVCRSGRDCYLYGTVLTCEKRQEGATKRICYEAEKKGETGARERDQGPSITRLTFRCWFRQPECQGEGEKGGPGALYLTETSRRERGGRASERDTARNRPTGACPLAWKAPN